MTGTSQRMSHTLAARSARGTLGRACSGSFVPKEAIDHGIFLTAAAMTALNLERARTAPATEKSDERRAEDDDWERDGEKENADECRRRQADHHVVLERPLPDSHNSFQYDCKHCGLETEKQRNNDGYIAVGGIHVAQHHDGDDARHDEESAGHDATERTVHQPADIGRELLRLRS